MTLHIQINVSADEAGQFTSSEQRILSALSPSGTVIGTARVEVKPGHTDAPADGFKQAHEVGHKLPSVTDDQQKLLDDITDPDEVSAALKDTASAGTVTAEPEEKPKRKRRTKAEIEADKAEKEGRGSTGPAVLEDLGDGEEKAALSQQEIIDSFDAKLAAGEFTDKAETEVSSGPTEDAGPAPEEDVDNDEQQLQALENPTPKDAFERASALVDSGQSKRVKEALAEIGVERASHIKTAEQAAQFLSLVS